MKIREKHNMTGKSEYIIWTGMRQRCNNPNNFGYRYYGGRGIKVCDRWQNSFNNFYKDMGSRPSTKHTLDRIDSNGDYELSNCRWATMKVQQNNRTNNKQITYRGESLNLIQWADKTGTDFRKIHRRLQDGWSIEEALGYSTREVYRTCQYCYKQFISKGRQLHCSTKCRANFWYHSKNPDALRIS